VATAPYGRGESGFPREADGLDHIADAGAARDQCWMAIDGGVPDLPTLVVFSVTRSNDISTEGSAELMHCSLVEPSLSERGHASSVAPHLSGEGPASVASLGVDASIGVRGENNKYWI
jgi:hypothetical protein